jgi:eukaryotic-like serine/threonine-protein kinase
MSLRIMVIDDHGEFRALLRHHITVEWPSAELREHDPTTAGPLPADFRGEGVDVVLLDYRLGDHEDGMAYLKRFRKVSGFPPVIMLTAAGNEELAVQAIKAGATDYIPKQTMTHERLVTSIKTALEARDPMQVPVALTNDGAPPPSLVIPGYDLVRRIAEGGAGTIYLAKKTGGRESLVIKVMAHRLPTGEESTEAQRLSREFELIRKVDSPRIVRLHGLGVTDGHVYLVMEYFAHGSLREYLRGPIARAEALDFTRQIALALEIVHRATIVHRDLKPANVMRRADGSLVLIDFGTAKLQGNDLTLTRAGAVMGTPHYMSPEQCAGGELTAASDLYSVGVMLYEMLTGELPYTAATPLAVLYKHQYAPLPRLPGELSELQPLIDILMAKTPDERYPRARELIQHIEALLEPAA